MKKGLIICGYPGIGKSSIAGWNNCIDLESSYFSFRNGVPQKFSEWVPQYCETALDLANQGFTVLISCHRNVWHYLNEKIKYHAIPRCNIPIVIFRPKPDMKEAWGIRLVKRYLQSGSDKDLRAFEGAMKYWDEDMLMMNGQYLPIYYLTDITYDLRDYILQIRKKEGCDDEETSPSMEPMAGVEEACLDVPMVEENPDTSRDHSE